MVYKYNLTDPILVMQRVRQQRQVEMKRGSGGGSGDGRLFVQCVLLQDPRRQLEVLHHLLETVDRRRERSLKPSVVGAYDKTRAACEPLKLRVSE